MIYNLKELEHLIDVEKLKRLFDNISEIESNQKSISHEIDVNNLRSTFRHVVDKEERFSELLAMIVKAVLTAKYSGALHVWEEIRCQKCRGYGMAVEDSQKKTCDACQGLGISNESAFKIQKVLSKLKPI